MSRDRTVGDTFFIAFTTRAFATGIPTVLAGTPVVSAYEDAGLTQITAGITLGVDHDGVVGLNMLTIVATGANGYETVKDYNLAITTGTVGGVSVVGEVVGQFSLSLSAAAVDLANGTDGLTALKTGIDAIPTTAMRGTDGVDTATMRGTDSALLAANVPTNFSALGIESDGDITKVNLLDGNTAQTGDNFARLGAPAGASVSADIAALEADSIQKNAAYSNFEFLMVLTSDHVTPATGLTVTGERSIDGGAFSAVSGTIAEISNGIYQFDALAADTNGGVITWRFSEATADDTFVTFNTST